MSSSQHAKIQPISTLSRQDFWQQHVQQWLQSSQSKSAYCRDRGLKYHQFIYWHSRFASSEPGAEQRLAVPAKRFVTVAVANPVSTTSSAGLRLSLPNGTCIEGINAQSVEWVGALISQL